MGLMLTTKEHMSDLENEVESYRQGLTNMSKAHDRAVAQYRALRDSKDAQIADLHNEIEDLKSQINKLRKENGRLRQAVTYYEVIKKYGRNSTDSVPVHTE